MGNVTQTTEMNRLELADDLAERARLLFDISPLSKIKLLKAANSYEYLVEDQRNGFRTLLRIVSPSTGREDLNSEVLWLQEILKNSAILVPEPVAGLNGSLVQSLRLPFNDDVYHCVMFSYLPGGTPGDCEEYELYERFNKLGETAALLHQSGIQWNRPASFTRPALGFEPLLAAGLELQPLHRLAGRPCHRLLIMALDLIKVRLKAYGRVGRRYGLIQGGLDLDNLIFYNNRAAVLNFESCGYGWYLYDCTPLLGPIMHSPDADRLTASWIDGYRKIRYLPEEDRAEIPTFLILYRLVALSRLPAPECCGFDRETSDFLEVTAALCENYLSAHT